jgi:hypothetical protein
VSETDHERIYVPPSKRSVSSGLSTKLVGANVARSYVAIDDDGATDGVSEMSSISTTFSALIRRPNSLVAEAPTVVDTTRLTNSNAAVNAFIILFFVQVFDITVGMNDLHEEM